MHSLQDATVDGTAEEGADADRAVCNTEIIALNIVSNIDEAPGVSQSLSRLASRVAIRSAAATADAVLPSAYHEEEVYFFSTCVMIANAKALCTDFVVANAAAKALCIQSP
jgi:hypothetical protein